MQVGQPVGLSGIGSSNKFLLEHCSTAKSQHHQQQGLETRELLRWSVCLDWLLDTYASLAGGCFLFPCIASSETTAIRLSQQAATPRANNVIRRAEDVWTIGHAVDLFIRCFYLSIMQSLAFFHRCIHGTQLLYPTL